MRKFYFDICNKITIIFIFFLVFSNTINAVTLIFVNKTDGPLSVKLNDWKRFKGIIYKQEEPRVVEPEKSLIWSPQVKPDIRQNVIEVYKNNKLIDSVSIKPYKEVSVPRGHTRTIFFQASDIYQDKIEKDNRVLSNVFTIGLDLFEKAREKGAEAINSAFSLYRKLIRNNKNILNPEPHNIIHQNPYANKNASVRVGGSIADDNEKKIFYKRQKVVRKYQEKFLGIKFQENQKPLVISFVASGGGQRAKLCTLGTALGAEKIGLFNCGTYFSTLSGSTWFLAPWMLSGLSLSDYKKRAIEEAKVGLGLKDSVIDVKQGLDILESKFAFGEPIGVGDLYGILNSIYYLKGFGENQNPQRCYLSSFAHTDKMLNGESFIPVFTAVTAEIGMEHKWCWFTPWEFGSCWFGKSGAYIPIWAFGREFTSIKSSKNWGTAENPLYGPRPTLGFIMGICTFALSGKLDQIFDQFFGKVQDSPVKAFLNYMFKKTDLKKVRVSWVDVYNFMYKWPESLFSKFKYLKLADAGVKMVLPIFPTYRRPKEGNIIKDGSAPDVIFLFDSSATISKKELELQVQYAKKRGLPFPKIDYSVIGTEIINIFSQNPDPKKFKDYEIPTVIYMPRILDQDLLAKTGDPYARKLAALLARFDIKSCMKDTCNTFNFKYDKKQDGKYVSELVMGMTEFNIIASVDKIKDAMLKRVALNKKRDDIIAQK